MFLFLLLLVGVNAKYYDLALKRETSYEEWNIHGLWPQYNKTSWPQYCNQTICQKFNWRVLRNISSDLEKYWMSYGDLKDDVLFWKHEWVRHGCCTSFSLYDYFNTVLKVYKYAKAKNFYNCCKQYKVMDKWQSCLLAYDWKSLYFQHCEF